MWEVERLLTTAKDNGTLPKYLLLENVKNLIGRRFKPEFDEGLSFLAELGYRKAYKVLNARDYGIPQNRERVFCVSVLGGGAEYKFPEQDLEAKKAMLIDIIDRITVFGDRIEVNYKVKLEAFTGGGDNPDDGAESPPELAENASNSVVKRYDLRA